MIPVPSGYTVVGEDAAPRDERRGSLVLYPPAGRDLGEVHYFERAGALRSVETIIQEALAGLPGLQVQKLRPPEPLCTAEGEYASFVDIDGKLADWPLKLYLGIVFADDFVSLLRVLSWNGAELEPVARELLHRCSLGLGVRRRRFLYEPPPGWSVHTQDLVVTFYAPGFPKELGSITVFPANPVSETPQSVYDAWLEKEWQAGFIVAEATGPWLVSSRHGVHGSHFRITGRYDDGSDDGDSINPRSETPPLSRELVVLQQAPYLYVLRLDSALDEKLDEHRAIFRQVVSSVQPLPGKAAQDLVGHWAL